MKRKAKLAQRQGNGTDQQENPSDTLEPAAQENQDIRLKTETNIEHDSDDSEVQNVRHDSLLPVFVNLI